MHSVLQLISPNVLNVSATCPSLNYHCLLPWFDLGSGASSPTCCGFFTISATVSSLKRQMMSLQHYGNSFDLTDPWKILRFLQRSAFHSLKTIDLIVLESYVMQRRLYPWQDYKNDFCLLFLCFVLEFFTIKIMWNFIFMSGIRLLQTF